MVQSGLVIFYYEAALNHPPASQCPDLQNYAATCTPSDITIAEDAPTLAKVEKAVRQLRNGTAAGSNKITPELLQYAESPIS